MGIPFLKPLAKGTASEGSLGRDRTRQLSSYIVSREERRSLWCRWDQKTNSLSGIALSRFQP